jgi:predicted nucleic acid-binding protein
MAADSVFVDTNGWLAVLSKDDALHPIARARWPELFRVRRQIVLTDWIIAETGNGLARTPQRREFADAVRRMASSPRVRIISMSPTLVERALLLYSERPDKTWGLVDCASFLVMQDEGITDAFTTDRHFEQIGFTCLLPASAT